MYQTAAHYFENVDPEAFALMPDLEEDNEWLLNQAKERGIKVKASVDLFTGNQNGELEYPVELLQERFG